MESPDRQPVASLSDLPAIGHLIELVFDGINRNVLEFDLPVPYDENIHPRHLLRRAFVLLPMHQGHIISTRLISRPHGAVCAHMIFIGQNAEKLADVKTDRGQYIFEARVRLAGLDPEAVQVELYADAPDGVPVRQPMNRVYQVEGTPGEYIYIATELSARPPGDYTARLRPRCDDIAMPLEDAHILWQR